MKANWRPSSTGWVALEVVVFLLIVVPAMVGAVGEPADAIYRVDGARVEEKGGLFVAYTSAACRPLSFDCNNTIVLYNNRSSPVNLNFSDNVSFHPLVVWNWPNWAWRFSKVVNFNPIVNSTNFTISLVGLQPANSFKVVDAGKYAAVVYSIKQPSGRPFFKNVVVRPWLSDYHYGLFGKSFKVRLFKAN